MRWPLPARYRFDTTVARDHRSAPILAPPLLPGTRDVHLEMMRQVRDGDI